MRRRGAAPALLPAKIVLFAVSVVLMAQMVGALQIEVVSQGHQALAIALEKGMQRDSAYYKDLDSSARIDRFVATCRHDLTRSTLTIRLGALNAALADGDRAAILAAAEVAHDDIESELKCSPMDGNAWLRLAMLEALKDGASARTVTLLDRSYEWAPAEAWVLLPRLQFEARLASIGIGLDSPRLRADIRHYAAEGRAREFAAVYASLPASLQSIFDSEVEDLPPERLADLRKAVGDIAAQK